MVETGEPRLARASLLFFSLPRERVSNAAGKGHLAVDACEPPVEPVVDECGAIETALEVRAAAIAGDRPHGAQCEGEREQERDELKPS
jgi:hypothetical protein